MSTSQANLTIGPNHSSSIESDHNYYSSPSVKKNQETTELHFDETDESEQRNCWQRVSYGNKRHSTSENGSHIKKTCIGSETKNPLTIRNKFEVLNDMPSKADIEMNQEQDGTAKKENPPPIFIPNIININNMIGSIEEIISKDSYSYKCITRDKVKINTNTIDAYRGLVRHLTEKKVSFHTYQIKKERAYRVVLKNMHYSTDLNDIKGAIEDHGYAIRNISNLKSARTKEPLSIFFVDLEPASNNKDIFKIEYLLNAKIVFEPPHKRNDVVQCKKCQRYGHTKSYCWYQHRCVKCGCNHDTSTCLKPTTSPPKCVLCGGEHPANYKGCSVYRDIKHKSFPSRRLISKTDPISSPTTDKNDNKLNPTDNQVQDTTTTNEPLLTPSYAQITSGNSSSDVNCDLTKTIHGFLNKFEILMTQQAQQVNTLINLLTTVISKLK